MGKGCHRLTPAALKYDATKWLGGPWLKARSRNLLIVHFVPSSGIQTFRLHPCESSSSEEEEEEEEKGLQDKIKHEGKNERKKEAWADEKVKEAKGRSSKSYSPPTPTPKLWWARQPTPKATIYLSSSPSFGWYCLSKRNEVPTDARLVRTRSKTLVLWRQKFFQASPRRSLFSSQANRIGFYVLIFRSF